MDSRQYERPRPVAGRAAKKTRDQGGEILNTGVRVTGGLFIFFFDFRALSSSGKTVRVPLNCRGPRSINSRPGIIARNRPAAEDGLHAELMRKCVIRGDNNNLRGPYARRCICNVTRQIHLYATNLN